MAVFQGSAINSIFIKKKRENHGFALLLSGASYHFVLILPIYLCFFFQIFEILYFNQIGPDQIEALYQYAKFQFECGNYSGAADYLYQYRALCTNSDRRLSALWGKMAAEILMQNWDIALEELNQLKEKVDDPKVFFESYMIDFLHRVLSSSRSKVYASW